MDDLNPVFETVLEIKLGNQSQEARQVRFWMYDWDGGGEFDDIGMVEASVQELLNELDSTQPWTKPLVNPKKPKSKRGNIKVYVMSTGA